MGEDFGVLERKKRAAKSATGEASKLADLGFVFVLAPCEAVP
jgi:hypothetical protein